MKVGAVFSVFGMIGVFGCVQATFNNGDFGFGMGAFPGTGMMGGMGFGGKMYGGKSKGGKKYGGIGIGAGISGFPSGMGRISSGLGGFPRPLGGFQGGFGGNGLPSSFMPAGISNGFGSKGSKSGFMPGGYASGYGYKPSTAGGIGSGVGSFGKGMVGKGQQGGYVSGMMGAGFPGSLNSMPLTGRAGLNSGMGNGVAYPISGNTGFGNVAANPMYGGAGFGNGMSLANTGMYPSAYGFGGYNPVALGSTYRGNYGSFGSSFSGKSGKGKGGKGWGGYGYESGPSMSGTGMLMGSGFGMASPMSMGEMYPTGSFGNNAGLYGSLNKKGFGNAATGFGGWGGAAIGSQMSGYGSGMAPMSAGFGATYPSGFGGFSKYGGKGGKKY